MEHAYIRMLLSCQRTPVGVEQMRSDGPMRLLRANGWSRRVLWGGIVAFFVTTVAPACRTQSHEHAELRDRVAALQRQTTLMGGHIIETSEPTLGMATVEVTWVVAPGQTWPEYESWIRGELLRESWSTDSSSAGPLSFVKSTMGEIFVLYVEPLPGVLPVRVRLTLRIVPT